MSILVTGGTGDVGRQLLRQLVEKGERPVAFDIAPKPELLEEIADKFIMVRGDVLNLAEVLGAIKQHGVRRIIHLASLLTNDAEKRPYDALSVNVIGTANIMEAARLFDIERVIYASTSSVYGPTSSDATVDEEFEKRPSNIYGVSKLCAEHYSSLYAEKYGIEFAAIRLRLLLGPGQRNDTGARSILKIPSILEKISRGEEVIIPYHPDEKLEVTHPNDAALAMRLACFVERLPHKAYNVMSGSYRYSEIAKAFESAWPGCKVKAELPHEGAPRTARRFGRYDISLAKRELHYTPQYDIYRIIKEIVDYELRKG